VSGAGHRVSSNDVALRVDAVDLGTGSSGEVYRVKYVSLQAEVVNGGVGIDVVTHDLAVGVDAPGLCAAGAGEIDRYE
jgi:hypothetical protein